MLGGVANLVHRTLEGRDVQALVRDLIQKITTHANIQVITNAFIVDHSGMPGLFKTGMQVGPQMFYRQISHGVTILATGALPNRPDEYLLGRHPAIMTQLDADALLAGTPSRTEHWQDVVMIQCVGSRQPDNPNCSRVCCQTAIKNALRILDKNPEAQVWVLYRDMRTYGFQEDYYRLAREKGSSSCAMTRKQPPRVQAEGHRVSVSFTDPILGRPLVVDADALLLSTGFVSDDESTEDLAAIFKVPRTTDGYFLEDHVKLRPVDLSRPGFFLAEPPTPLCPSGKRLPRPRRRRPGPDPAQPRPDQPGGVRGPGGLQKMRRLPDLCPGLSLRGSLYQRGRVFGDRPGQVPRLWGLRLRVSGQGHTTDAV